MQKEYINTEKTKQCLALDNKYYMNTFGNRYGIVLAKGQGSYVTDTNDKEYLDLLAGIAVNVLGHSHPKLVEAISEQAQKLIHCSNLYFNEPQALLAAKLCQLCHMDKVFLANSGAEANECAIKLARAYFYKKGKTREKIISAKSSFHGRTLATITATGQEKYSKAYAPLPQTFIHLPYNDIATMEESLDDDCAAVILELIQGESGIHPATQEYISAVRQLCTQHGSLLIIDEIQTGMGRSGTFTACEQYELEADILTLAKGLAGGVPIGACLAKDEVASAFSPGDHGTTFGGNPLASAAALAVLVTIEDDNLLANVHAMNTYLVNEVESLAKRLRIDIKIRGLGLMLALELENFDATKLRQGLQSEGVLVNSIGEHTLRLLPPLNINKNELDFFIEKLSSVLQNTSIK